MTCGTFQMAKKLFGALAILFLLIASVRADDSPALYKEKCAFCHGPDGKGSTTLGKKIGVRDFASPEVRKETDRELIEITTKGKNNMPAYKSSLKDSQIKGLIAYIIELARKK